MNQLEKARIKLIEIMNENGWANEQINVVSARTLTANEAIGTPERDDYPILKGKEVMIEASFRGSKGQAFTDQPGSRSGSLKEIMELPLNTNLERAVFIATANAMLKALNKIDKTVHCRNEEPKECAKHMVGYIKEKFGNPKIAFIGLQPGMIAELSQYFAMKAVDLDPDNIGKKFNSVIIQDVSHTKEIIDWADIILATGSTSVNDSMEQFIGDKPVVFFGVTISAIAYLNNLNQYCHCGH
ncbi:MAG: DUF364 domain-containing protein [Clostridia bacterium]|nr:DUF364 domain-containing protein [Clostridia bacterium]